MSNETIVYDTAICWRCFDQFDTRFPTDVADGLRRAMVGDKGLDLREMPDPDWSRAVEFTGIAGKDHVSCIGDDCLGDFHFPEIVIEQGAVGVDSRDADHRVIDLELPYEIYRRLTDNSAVLAPNHVLVLTQPEVAEWGFKLPCLMSHDISQLCPLTLSSVTSFSLLNPVFHLF